MPSGLAAPPLARTALDDGTTLAWRDTGGGGPVVVLCHPHTGRSESFTAQCHLLARRGYRVICPDRRSYGASAGPTDGGTQGGDLATVLEAAGTVPPIALVGVAAGTVSAVDYVLGAPKRMRGVMLCNSLMAVRDPVWQERLAEVQAPLAAAGLTLAEKELSSRFRRDQPDRARDWHEIAEGNIASGAGEPPQGTRHRATFSALAALPCPLFLTTGTDDLYMPPRLLTEAAQRLPNARCRLLNDAGHAPHIEAPEDFNAMLLTFLDALPPLSSDGTPHSGSALGADTRWG